jgi:hypothetical protein
MRPGLEALLISGIGAVIWFFTTLRSTNSKNQPIIPDGNTFFTFLKDFTDKGGLKHLFPGEESRDTSIQFELISQVNLTTTVGRPISLTVRNAGQERRGMRYYGNQY